MADAASVIFYVFLVGGAFAVVERTGALAQLVNWLAQRLARRGIWVIPIVGFAFAWGGILIQMQEELIAFVPVLLLLTRRLGFNAAHGGGDEPRRRRRGGLVQPDQSVPGGHRPEGGAARAAQRLGDSARRSCWPAWLVWIAGTMRFARRTRVAPEAAPAADAGAAARRLAPDAWCSASSSSRS